MCVYIYINYSIIIVCGIYGIQDNFASLRRTPQPLTMPQPCPNRSLQAYDLTKFAKVHPGGAKLITDAAGMDATAIFDPIHPKVGWPRWPRWPRSLMAPGTEVTPSLGAELRCIRLRRASWKMFLCSHVVNKKPCLFSCVCNLNPFAGLCTPEVVGIYGFTRMTATVSMVSLNVWRTSWTNS